MENCLETELDESLGYSKYDYKNMDTDNSRNGYNKKTLRTSFGDAEISVPVTVRRNLSLSLSRKPYILPSVLTSVAATRVY